MLIFRSPSNEFWDSGYEIPSQSAETDSGLSQDIDFEWDKGVSYSDDFSNDVSSPKKVTSPTPPGVDAKKKESVFQVLSRKLIRSDNFSCDTSSPKSQKVSSPRPHDVDAKKKESVSQVPLGKLIRDCARAPNIRPRDRWRERSVSRARDCLVASKRRTVGLPPAFRPPADDRAMMMMPPPRRSGDRASNLMPPLRRNCGSRMLPPRWQFPDDRRTDTTSSTNMVWLQQSIEVSEWFYVD